MQYTEIYETYAIFTGKTKTKIIEKNEYKQNDNYKFERNKKKNK